MKKVNITPENISKLKSKEVFVFGSNLSGIHGGGAAKIAKDKFGAIQGKGIGYQGKSYALPTKDKNIETLPISEIKKYVDDLLEVVKMSTKNHFLITAVGCGLAGYTAEDIAPLFKDFVGIENISLPQSFIDVLEASTDIIGFKGFDPNMKCRDFQYEFGKDYEMDGEVEACSRGFHFCEHPLNVFSYYPPNTSRYANVIGSGKSAREDGGDTKVAVSKLHVGAEISLKGLTEAAVKFVFDRAKWSEGPNVEGDNEGATASGYQGAATASGNRGAATASGYQGAATASGD
ncbi:A1S_2505 family phage non-structural protein, partial [Flavobacterium sp.]